MKNIFISLYQAPSHGKEMSRSKHNGPQAADGVDSPFKFPNEHLTTGQSRLIIHDSHIELNYPDTKGSIDLCRNRQKTLFQVSHPGERVIIASYALISSRYK